MINFNIRPTANKNLEDMAVNKINNLTKPKGSLGGNDRTDTQKST